MREDYNKNFDSFYEKKLSDIREAGLWRSLETKSEKAQIDFLSNDYLGLRSDENLLENIRESLRKLPCGSGASRLLGGNDPLFLELEREFSAFKKAPQSLFFCSGFQANLALGQALSQSGFHIFSDELNHASIIDGLRTHKSEGCKRTIFRHADFADLEKELLTSNARYKVIFTESLFSMDGDTADLGKLADLAQKYGALLVIDEAHALGCYGKTGSGLVEEFGLKHDSIVTVNPCGKAFAAQGALISGPKYFIEYLINTARSFIYSTAPSLWVATALRKTIPVIVNASEQRLALHRKAEFFRSYLKGADFNIGPSNSYIVPVIIGETQNTIALASYLQKNGIAIRAIRPPTVPEGSSRLRFALSSSMSDRELDVVVGKMTQFREQKSYE